MGSSGSLMSRLSFVAGGRLHGAHVLVSHRKRYDLDDRPRQLSGGRPHRNYSHLAVIARMHSCDTC